MLLTEKEVQFLLDDVETDTVSVEDGKYTIVCNNGAGCVLRFGKPWRALTNFDIAVLYHIQELEEMKQSSQAKTG